MFSKKSKFKIITDGEIRENGSIKVEMDWNDAFIAKIREQGADGITDEDAVNQFLIYLLRCMIKPPAETPPLASDKRVSDEITPLDENNDIIQ